MSAAPGPSPTYLIQGQPHVTKVETDDSTGALVGLVESHADGTLADNMVVRNGVTTATTYDALGVVASIDVIQADGLPGTP